MFENEVFYLEKPSVDVGISSRVENILSIALIIGKVLPVIVIIIYIFMYYRKKKKCTTEQESQALKIQTRKELVPLLIGCLLVWFAPTFATWMFGKPIIYIYPEKEINLSVTLGYPNDITCSYPNYSQYNGWNVKAFPNGDLIDINSGKKLYSLYWEGRGNKVNTSMKQGFCVKGEDTAKFLEEKLDLLGLNDKETSSFKS